MKIFKSIFLAAVLATSLGACGSFLQNGMVQSAAVSSTSTSNIQAHSLKAAGEFYIIGTHAARVALDNGYVSKENAQKMIDIEAQLKKALDDGLAAQLTGNSPGAGVALALFNANYGKLAALIPGLH